MNILRVNTGAPSSHATEGAETAGLAMAVGGLYLTPEELAETYLMMANEGMPVPLAFENDHQVDERSAFIGARAANGIMALLGQHDSFDRLVTLKTGTSHNKQDAWAAMVTDRHVVIVWLGMPDNDPTEILTGASAARPQLCSWQMCWNCGQPVSKSPEKGGTARRLMKKTCPQLISHPKDGAVIYQEGTVLPVRSNLKDTFWYLNGKRAVMNKQNIVIQDGVLLNLLTAASEACRQTIVFDQKQ